jgi:hypothetical protein
MQHLEQLGIVTNCIQVLQLSHLSGQLGQAVRAAKHSICLDAALGRAILHATGLTMTIAMTQPATTEGLIDQVSHLMHIKHYD